MVAGSGVSIWKPAAAAEGREDAFMSVRRADRSCGQLSGAFGGHPGESGCDLGTG